MALLDYNPDVNSKDKYGRTPLAKCLLKRESTLDDRAKMVKLLLAAGTCITRTHIQTLESSGCDNLDLIKEHVKEPTKLPDIC